jgi:hypothetical protein
VLVKGWKKLAWTGLSAILLGLLAACGGGGGGGGSGGLGTTTSATPTPVFTFAFTPTTSVDPGTTATSNVVTIVGFGRTLSASADATLLRNGTPLGTTGLFQDGDQLQARTFSPPSGSSRMVTVKLDTMTETWNIVSRPAVIGAYFSGRVADPSGGSGHWNVDVSTSGNFLAVPFTPTQSFNARYGAILLGPSMPDMQPCPITFAIYSDAQGVPGARLAVTTPQRDQSGFCMRYINSAQVLGGGTYALADNTYDYNAPQGQFGTQGVPLTAGARYWLVQQYQVSTTYAQTVMDAAQVTTGPLAKQSVDGVTWTDWGAPWAYPGPTSGVRYMPGFFVGTLAN